MMVDDDARYLKTHEWAKKQGGNVFSVGLSAYAAKQLGDIVYVKLSDVGRELSKEDSFGVIESVKSTVDVSMPLSGKIIEVNADIPDNPDMLSKDAYGAGWLARVEATNSAEWDALMDATSYRQFLETDG